MATPRFTTQEFYGGAIKGTVPHDWIDSSTLREVPDHQEIFLSPTTLSSQIIEINQRVTDVAPSSTPNQLATPESLDHAAVRYHLHDLLDESDTLTEVIAPQKVVLERFGDAIPAYRGVVTLTSPKNLRRGAGPGPNGRGEGVGGAVAGSSADGSLTTRTSCHYLLVRLEKQETDLLVFVNVPAGEFEAHGDPRGLAGEEALAEEMVSALVRELEVVEWGLFV